MFRRSLSSVHFLIVAMLVVLSAGCATDEVSRPLSGTGIRVRVQVAPRGAEGPEVGPVDTLRFDLRGPGGELLVHPTVIPVEPEQTEFSISLAAPLGRDVNITAMALGSRPVLGGPPDSGRGILFRGRAVIDVEPGNIPTVPIFFQLFVPEFVDFVDVPGESYTIRWTEVPGADHYRLTRSGSGGSRDTTLLATSFTGSARPVTYQVRAVDFSGLQGAPSDRMTVEGLPEPTLCVDPMAIDLGSDSNTGTFAITNCGSGGTLAWTVNESVSWLSVNPLSGSATTESDVVTITADRTGLVPGNHEGTVLVTAGTMQEVVTVLLFVPPVPEICLSAENLTFDAGITTRTVNITNCGTGGQLDWTVADDQPWLAINPASGSTAGETDAVSFQVDRAGLAPGNHTATATFQSNGGSAAVAVTLVVPPEPVLCVAPGSLDFGTSATSLQANVTNCGTGGSVSWTLNDDQPWLTVNPVAGTTTLETDPVTINVNRAGLAPGPYAGTVTFTSNAGSATVAVSMTVPAVPALCVSPGTLAFGPNLSTRDLLVTNCGTGGLLAWTANDNQPWIVISSRSGSTGAETDTIEVVIDRAGLDPGPYSGTVTIAAGQESQVIDVTMEVEAVPELCVSVKGLNFAPAVSQLSFDITNCGTGGTLNWSIESDQPWLEARPLTGNTTTESDGITVTVDRTGLPAITHNGKLAISSNGGTVSIPVTLEVSAEPVLCLGTHKLDFGPTLFMMTFTVTNCGNGGILRWTVDPGDFWIDVVPEAGTTTTESDQVTVTVDRSDLPAGSHTGRVYLDSNGGVDSVEVVLVVPSEPALCLSKSTIDFGASQTSDSFTITNCGNGGTLTWTVDDDRPWITVTPLSGSTTTNEPDGITVTVNRAGLNPNSYSGTITVTSNAGTGTVTIAMQVPNPPALCAAPGSLDFGQALNQMTFSITNCGAGTLSWTLQDDQPWIALNPTSGTTTTESDVITVTVNRTGLSPGTHEGFISIGSNGGVGTIPVTLTIPQPPPAAPTNLKATQDQLNAFLVILTWTDNAGNESGFTVERSANSGPFLEVGSTASNVTTLNNQIGCGTFVYRVRAWNAAGVSAWSNVSNQIFLICGDE